MLPPVPCLFLVIIAYRYRKATSGPRFSLFGRPCLLLCPPISCTWMKGTKMYRRCWSARASHCIFLAFNSLSDSSIVQDSVNGVVLRILSHLWAILMHNLRMSLPSQFGCELLYYILFPIDFYNPMLTPRRSPSLVMSTAPKPPPASPSIFRWDHANLS